MDDEFEIPPRPTFDEIERDCLAATPEHQAATVDPAYRDDPTKARAAVQKLVGIASDGGSTDYYKLPSHARDIDDLIAHKRMGFRVGNIFKAAYRMGEKAGADRAYDLRKIVFFAQRELEDIEAGR